MLCADQPLATIREWTNEAALATGTPWMIAQYAGPMAVVGCSYRAGRLHRLPAERGGPARGAVRREARGVVPVHRARGHRAVGQP
jgi:hypothetical protein